MFQRCLICTEFSDGLDRLTHFVPTLAKAGLKKIVFYHSAPLWKEGEIPDNDSLQVKKARESLSVALSEVPPGVEVHIEVSLGEPLETIPKLIEAYSIDVIFLGISIHNSWQDKLFANTTKGLAKLTDKPLMILRPQLLTTYTLEELSLRTQHLWRSLLLVYDDNKTGNYLLEQFQKYAQNRPDNSLRDCLLVSVIEKSREDVITENRVKEAHQKLATIKNDLEQLSLQVKTEVRVGDHLSEILSVAAVADITAIAVATQYDNNLFEWTIPNFAQELINHSWFPTLFFSPKK